MPKTYKYSNVAFLTNAREPCGFVACYHVISAHVKAAGEVEYDVMKLGPQGNTLDTVQMDEFTIEQGLVHHDYTMYSNVADALTHAESARQEAQ